MGNMSRDKVIVSLLVALLGSSLVVFLVHIFGFVGKPYELILGEGFLMYQADLVSKGLPLFSPLTPTYFLIIPHTPLYVTIAGAISSITGPSLVVGRLLSLTSGVGVAYIIFLLTKNWTKNFVVGLLASLLVISTYVFRFLSPLYRMDILCVFFSILGVYLVIKWEDRGRLIYWSIPFLLASFWSKQYFIAAPIAICIYLLVKNRSWRPAFKFGSLYLISLLGTLVIGGLLTNWELIIHNFIYVGLQSQMDWFIFWGAMRASIVYHGPYLLAIIGYFGYKLHGRYPWKLLDIYFIVSFVIMVAAMGKRGGGFHYALESVVVGGVLIGVILGRFLEVLKQKRANTKSVLLGGILVTLIGLQVLGFPLGRGYTNYQYLDSAKEGNQQLQTIVDTTEGHIFADRVASPMVLSGDPGKWIAWEPALLFVGKLYEREDRFGWDQSELVRRLKSGYYELVIAPHDIEVTWTLDPTRIRWVHIYRDKLSPEIAYAILDNFELVLTTEKVGTNLSKWRHYIYEYRGNSDGDG